MAKHLVHLMVKYLLYLLVSPLGIFIGLYLYIQQLLKPLVGFLGLINLNM